MVRDVLDDDVRLVFDAADVEGKKAKPRAVGAYLAEVTRLLEATGENFALRHFGFENSIVFVLEPEVPASLVEEIDKRLEADPEAKINEAELERLIPESVAAGLEIAEIVALPAEEALERALAYRPAVAQAYVAVARTLMDHGASMKVDAPGAKEQVVTTAEASHIVEVAENPVPDAPLRATIRGFLIAADARAMTFKVRLDPDFPRPDGMPAHTKYVEGRYTDAAERAVVKHSLWNARVSAKVIASRSRYPDHVSSTITGYSFEAIEPFGGAD